jgi:hypothetical protein
MIYKLKDIKGLILLCGELLASFQRKKYLSKHQLEALKIPLFEPLFMYYITLSTIVNRLFAIWNRSVYVNCKKKLREVLKINNNILRSGSLTWLELLAGLELIVMEQFPLKFKCTYLFTLLSL